MVSQPDGGAVRRPGRRSRSSTRARSTSDAHLRGGSPERRPRSSASRCCCGWTRRCTRRWRGGPADELRSANAQIEFLLRQALGGGGPAARRARARSRAGARPPKDPRRRTARSRPGRNRIRSRSGRSLGRQRRRRPGAHGRDPPRIHAVYTPQCRVRRMSIGHTLLGLLESGPRHGYDLKRAFDENVRPRPAAALRPGLLDHVPAAEERPRRGRRRWRRAAAPSASGTRSPRPASPTSRSWLAQPEKPEPYLQSTLYTKIVLALLTGRERRRSARHPARRASAADARTHRRASATATSPTSSSATTPCSTSKPTCAGWN